MLAIVTGAVTAAASGASLDLVSVAATAAKAFAERFRIPKVAKDAQDLIEHCRREIAGFKVPKRMVIVPELPRNAMGKVQKNLLREQHKTLFAG